MPDTFVFQQGLYEPVNAACAELERAVQERTFYAAKFVIELKAAGGGVRSRWMPRAQRVGTYLRRLQAAWDSGDAGELRRLLRMELAAL